MHAGLTSDRCAVVRVAGSWIAARACSAVWPRPARLVWALGPALEPPCKLLERGLQVGQSSARSGQKRPRVLLSHGELGRAIPLW
jgi:hypothetical protein